MRGERRKRHITAQAGTTNAIASSLSTEKAKGRRQKARERKKEKRGGRKAQSTLYFGRAKKKRQASIPKKKT